MSSVNAQPQLNDGLYAVIDTEKGSITCELDFTKAPLTVSNFVGLAEGSIDHDEGDGPFYDGLNFHRVVDDFVIQGGCPQGTGTGGPGYAFPPMSSIPICAMRVPGYSRMANSGANTNGSQFFITHRETPHLDDRHSVFGRVVDGMEIVNDIEAGDRIKSVEILRIGEKAESFIVDQEKFDTLIREVKSGSAEKEAAAREGLVKQITEKWPGLKQTDTGVYIEVLEEGSGENARPKATVTVKLRAQPLERQRHPVELRRRSGGVLPGQGDPRLAGRHSRRRRHAKG